MDALYCRQSIEKKDSISIESQLEYCLYETHENEYKQYIDRGFSGKDTNRPAFESMINDIKKGMISRVIVYKLDRISRSILDFSNMIELFQKYNVEFISSTEKFDTSTPIGHAMLNICIVFAQLERETIQKRIKDNYYSRSKRGFYMGGRVPYGFTLKCTVIEGIKTAMYEQIPEEIEHIKIMYHLYSSYENSLIDIVRYFDENNIKNLRGKNWASNRISEILSNPIYVKADVDIYNFFQNQDINIINPISDFTGNNACYLYKSKEDNSYLVVAPHKGIISSSEWIKCRLKCLENKHSTMTYKHKNSWLTGKLKCGNCDYSLVFKTSKTKWNKYFVCSSKNECNGIGMPVYVDVIENYILNAIRNKLSEFEVVYYKSTFDFELNEKKVKISQIESEINKLVSKVMLADDILMEYINERVNKLEAEKEKLKKETLNNKYKLKLNYADILEYISFEDKQKIVDILVDVINIYCGRIEIIWKI